MPPLTNRLDAPWLDAALHLMDRQVIDADGKMVCNVDDLELLEGAGGELTVTGILVGAAALVPRFSGRHSSWLRDMWVSLGIQYAARKVPLYLPLDLVDHVGSDVRVRVPREGLLDRQPASGPGTTQRRMDDLLGLDVVRDGERLGHVLDVRLEPRKQESRMLVVSLVVGRGRPGSLLGYDRGGVDGPALVNWAVTMLHRHSHLVPVESVRAIEWDAGRVEVSGPVKPLRT